MNDQTLHILYLGMRHYTGIKLGRLLQYQTRRIWAVTPVEKHICELCGKHINRTERSVDHILPKSVCYDLGLIGMVYDPRNMRMTHTFCNQKRDQSLEELPDSIKNKIYSMYEAKFGVQLKK